MADEMPDLMMEVMTVTLDRVTGRVEVDYQGMNYLEAIGALTVALNIVQDTPYELEFEGADDDEADD